MLDLGLVDIDGFEVLRRLRAAGETVPVIVLTARSSVTDTVTGLESGADDYMAKPFRFEELPGPRPAAAAGADHRPPRRRCCATARSSSTCARAG